MAHQCYIKEYFSNNGDTELNQSSEFPSLSSTINFYVLTVLIGPKKCHLERSRHRIVFLFCQSAAAAAESDSIGMHNERSLDNVVLVI